MKKKSTNPTKVITGVQTRWSYANVWNPKAMAEGAKPKYSVSLIIPKSDTVTIQKIKAAIKAAYEEGQSKLKGNGKSVPPLAAIKTPLRDGDVERPDDEAYQNAYFVNANSPTAPGIIQAISRDILCYAIQTLSHCFIVAHVHDEIIIECDKRMSVEEVCGQMSRTPPWIPGLLLRADGYECEFYKKD